MRIVIITAWWVFDLNEISYLFWTLSLSIYLSLCFTLDILFGYFVFYLRFGVSDYLRLITVYKTHTHTHVDLCIITKWNIYIYIYIVIIYVYLDQDSMFKYTRLLFPEYFVCYCTLLIIHTNTHPTHTRSIRSTRVHTIHRPHYIHIAYLS